MRAQQRDEVFERSCGVADGKDDHTDLPRKHEITKKTTLD
jgi:hypothetical protein